MRIHSDIIRPEDVRNALRTAQSEGRVADHVQFAGITVHGSRKRSGAIEVSIGTHDGTSFISDEVREYLEGSGLDHAAINRAKRRWARNGYVYDEELPRSATWHEWGHFIAELFAIDPRAIIGSYDEADSFFWQTYNSVNHYQFKWNGRRYDFLGDIEDWEVRTDNYNYWS